MLILPIIIVLISCYIIPIVMLLIYSFSSEWGEFTFSMIQYKEFFFSPINLQVLWDTMLLGGKVMLFTTIVGYPLALFYMQLGKRGRNIMLFLTALPLFISNVVRTLAWIVLLGEKGFINDTLLKIGLISSPMQFLYTEFGLVIVLGQISLPLMVFPLMGVLSRVDRSFWEASTSLGMNDWRTFVRIIVPLSLPGLLTGWTLVFAASSMNFVTQSIIGGARLLYMPLYIYQNVTTLFNWPFAAAVSVIMVVSTGAVLALLTYLSNHRRINIHV